MNESKISIGLRIREIREQRRFNRGEFAEEIGISDGYMYDIERGRKGFTIETLLALSRRLGVSADYLLTGFQYSKYDMIIRSLNDCTEDELRDIENILLIISKYFKNAREEAGVF